MQDKNIPFCFLNIYKPKGITSFDVIYKLRKILNIKKIGHSGTLDPLADGVIQIGIGSCAKLLDYLSGDKEYIAEIRFGYTTETLDAEGEIIKAEAAAFTKEDLIKTINEFIGEVKQIPPIYSAIKVNGKKLYEIARKTPKNEVIIPERTVTIHNIELLNFEKINNEEIKAILKISCTKGAYIRTLALDIAKKLNTKSYLTKLTRTKAGNFNIENSIKIEDLDLEKNSINPKNVLNLPFYKLNEKEFNLVKNGVKITPKTTLNDGLTYMLIFNDELVSIAVLSDNKIKIVKNFC